MANALTTEEKHKLCLFIDDHPKAKAKDLIEYCRKEFQKEPSKSAISRVTEAHSSGKRFQAHRSNGKEVKRIREAKWPELEKALDLWIMDLRSDCQKL